MHSRSTVRGVRCQQVSVQAKAGYYCTEGGRGRGHVVVARRDSLAKRRDANGFLLANEAFSRQKQASVTHTYQCTLKNSVTALLTFRVVWGEGGRRPIFSWQCGSEGCGDVPLCRCTAVAFLAVGHRRSYPQQPPLGPAKAQNSPLQGRRRACEYR